jgi:hypothetical protein
MRLLKREKEDVRAFWALVGAYDDTGQLQLSAVFDWKVRVKVARARL